MKWYRDHVLTLGYWRDRMVTVDFDRLNVISSGSVVLKIDAKVCFPSRLPPTAVWMITNDCFGTAFIMLHRR
jgi:hypothetical protein